LKSQLFKKVEQNPLLGKVEQKLCAAKWKNENIIFAPLF
jgi:hypothetical protein